MKKIMSKVCNRYTVGLTLSLLSTAALAAPGAMAIVGGFAVVAAIAGIAVVAGASNNNNNDFIAS